MCSSLTEKGCETTLKALEYGAVEIIQKPTLGVKKFLEESKIRLCDIVKAAASARVKRIKPSHIKKVPPKLTADAVLSKGSSKTIIRTTEKVIVVGRCKFMYRNPGCTRGLCSKLQIFVDGWGVTIG